MLNNEASIQKFGVDTAENEASNVWVTFSPSLGQTKSYVHHPQTLLHGLLERPPDRHDLADALHAPEICKNNLDSVTIILKN